MGKFRQTFSKLAEYVAAVLETIADFQHIIIIVGVAGALAGSASIEFVREHYLPLAAIGMFAVLIVVALVARSLAANMALQRQDPVIAARRKQQDSLRILNESITSFRRDNPATRSLEDLRKKHHAHLKAICLNAQATFNALKPSMAPFSANIKHIVMADPDKTGTTEPCFAQIVGTWADDGERGKYTATIGRQFIPIGRCFWYGEMFNRFIGRDYFVHHDRRELAATLKEKDFEFQEPSFFLSWFAMPIYGSTEQPFGSVTDPPYIYFSRIGKMLVAGILCVDSLKAGAFRNVDGPELKRDIAIMEELSDAAFASYVAMQAISEDGGNLSPTETTVSGPAAS